MNAGARAVSERRKPPPISAAESGTIGAPAAIVSAIEDALRPFGVRINDLPATPERLLALIQSAQQHLQH